MAASRHQPAPQFLEPFLDDSLFRPFLQGHGMRDMLRAPEAEVVETECDIQVVPDVPGMTPDDIEIRGGAQPVEADAGS